jgi:hypothetical protein
VAIVAWLILALALAVQPATQIRLLAEGGDSPIRERLEVVIRSPNEWQVLSDRFAPGKPPQAVNFSVEMAVAIFVGSGRFSGYRVEILSVVRDAGHIVVRYRRGMPDAPRASASVHGAPYQIVAIPRDRRSVKFIEVRDLGGPAHE